MTTYLFDVIIVLLLAFFAWRGAKKGLVLSLCGLVAIFVAYFAASFLSGQLYQPVSNIIEPAIVQTIKEGIASGEGEASAPPAEGETVPEGEAVPEGPTLDELLDEIREAGLYSGFVNFLEDLSDQSAGQEPEQRTAADVLAGHLAKLIAKAGLFAIIFLGVLLIWFLVSHALDLAFHLPILSAVNWVGGLVLGFAKAALLVVVLVWLGQLAGIVPCDPETPVLSLFTVKRLGQLLNDLPI